MKYNKERGKYYRGLSREQHDETCLCRRCRARYDAIERKQIRLGSIKNSEDVQHLIRYSEEE